MSTLRILFGPIASGKSTYAKKQARHGCLIANDDAITMALHADQYGEYDESLKPLYKSLRNQIIAMGAALNRDVIVDSTALTRERRDGLRALGRSLDMRVELVTFRRGVFEGEADGIRRYNADPRGLSMAVWIKVGEVHRASHDPYTWNEGRLFDDVHDVEWRGTP